MQGSGYRFVSAAGSHPSRRSRARVRRRGGWTSLPVDREEEPAQDEHPLKRYLEGVGSEVHSRRYDRVVERRRAVALAHHYRAAEGLSVAEIGRRLGRSPATVKAYFYDPTGEKARAVKARYLGLCRGCGAYMQSPNGKGDAYAYCKACHPGVTQARWTRELVLSAMLEWRHRYGCLPSSYDWSRTHARRRGAEALERLAQGSWPAASVVGRLFGSWAAARAAASRSG